jgi:predicted RNA binding protein YcfA (HicA-like mRNA interferase family)
MTKLPSTNSRECVKALRRAGFEVKRAPNHVQMCRGSVHVTVPGNKRSIHFSTLKLVLKQAGLTDEEFIRLRKG